MSRELTAAEAAARLGVKRATLYAYVSRGLLHRHVAMDGRTSLFDADEVDQFRSGRRRATEGELAAVISTALTRVDDTELRIRGRDVVTMVDDGASYEDVADWLWGAEGEAWSLDSGTAGAVRAVAASMPARSPLIDLLRVATVAASAVDPLRFDPSPAGMRAAGRTMVLAMVEAVPLQRGGERMTGSVAERLWARLTPRRPLAARRAALDTALALLVDHGLAASTFGARIAASVRADPYSIVSAGLGVIGGTLHGAASGDVHQLLAAAGDVGPAAAVGEAHRRGRMVPGFGHTVYRAQDPRYGALMRRVSDAWRDDARLATVQEVRETVARRTDAIPNVDLALGALTWLADMRPDAGEAVFAIARTAGWVGHGIEEFGEAPLRFRPRARYTGDRTA